VSAFHPLRTLRLSIDFRVVRAALLLPIFLLTGAAKPQLAPLTDEDFQHLMGAAAVASSASSQLQPLTETVCVQRELKAPVADLEALTGWFHGADRLRSPSGNAVADQSIAAATLSEPGFAPQTVMPSLPKKFVMVGKVLPPECVVPHSVGRGPNWRHDESVVLAFTRPTLAKGYAFIQEYEECAGLCGTTYLRVFRKRAGKWTQVAQVILSVS